MKCVLEFEKFELSEINDVAKRVISYIKRPALIFVSGEMGAGKTTLIREICDTFGIKLVSSPTYAICNSYDQNGIRIKHLDLYRLETEEQVESAGVIDLISGDDDYCFVEWPERAELINAVPSKSEYFIKMSVSQNSERSMRLLSN